MNVTYGPWPKKIKSYVKHMREENSEEGTGPE
jgi:hypothetical protein